MLHPENAKVGTPEGKGEVSADFLHKLATPARIFTEHSPVWRRRHDFDESDLSA
jgi:hypothetical protein